MTNEQFELIKERLENSPNKDIVIAELKKAFPCLGCKWCDGLPHGACYSCE